MKIILFYFILKIFIGCFTMLCYFLLYCKGNQLWVAGAQSRLTLCVPWPVAHQAPLSMGFSRQEYWNRLPFPPPGDPPDAGIKPTSLVSPALAGGFFTTLTTWEALYLHYQHIKMRRKGAGSWTITWVRI